MNTWSTNDLHDEYTPSTHRRMDDAIEVAMRLAGTDAIGAIHVAIVERPTYDELRHYRYLAEVHGLTLTMTGDSIILRPRPVDPEAAEQVPELGLAALLPEIRVVAGDAWRRMHVWSAATAATHGVRMGTRWLHDHATNWNAGFRGLHEGVR
jgi:hypothetical protein